MLLEETKIRLLAANETTDSLLTQINDCYMQEKCSDEKILKEVLSELHNSGEIDFVEIVRTVNKDSLEYDFFIILRAFENVLPLLDSRVEDVLYCLIHLLQQAGRDLAIGGIYGVFENFCRVDEHRSRDSIEFILSQRDLSTYAPFLSSSILAYNSNCAAEAIQIIESLIANKNEVVRSQAYFSLGRLNVSETQKNVIWDLFSLSVCGDRDDACCASILRGILNFGARFPSYWPQIEAYLVPFVEESPPELLYEISDTIAFQRVEFPESILCLLLKPLSNVSSEHKGIIDNIDYLLVWLVERGSSVLAVELLESIINVGVKFTSLDYFSRELLRKYPELLNHIVTKWFLSGEILLCHGVSNLLNIITDNNIELTAERALLDDEEKLIFVSHKAVGWLFAQPITSVSFILSIYKIASETTRLNIEEILYDPLLLSYPGELKRFLQSCIENGFQKHLCVRLLERLQVYHTEIEKVSGLKELMAPSENVSAYWKNLNKSMQKAHEEASKSSLMSLFTTKQLLYGNSSVFYVHKGNGESMRQEMQMQSFSHSAELPRLNTLDPVILDYTLRVYRNERMTK